MKVNGRMECSMVKVYLYKFKEILYIKDNSLKILNMEMEYFTIMFKILFIKEILKKTKLLDTEKWFSIRMDLNMKDNLSMEKERDKVHVNIQMGTFLKGNG